MLKDEWTSILPLVCILAPISLPKRNALEKKLQSSIGRLLYNCRRTDPSTNEEASVGCRLAFIQYPSIYRDCSTHLIHTVHRVYTYDATGPWTPTVVVISEMMIITKMMVKMMMKMLMVMMEVVMIMMNEKMMMIIIIGMNTYGN